MARKTKAAGKPRKIADKPMDAAQQALFNRALQHVKTSYRRKDDLAEVMQGFVEEEGCYLDKACGAGLTCITLSHKEIPGSVVVSAIGSKRIMVSAHGNDKHEILRERHYKVQA